MRCFIYALRKLALTIVQHLIQALTEVVLTMEDGSTGPVHTQPTHPHEGHSASMPPSHLLAVETTQTPILLQQVAWLNAVQRPNKIQRAFLRIINLLHELKPFIPDQLLQSLTGGDGDGGGESSADEKDESKAGESARGLGDSARSSARSYRSYQTSVASSPSRSSGASSTSYSRGKSKGKAPKAKAERSLSAEYTQRWERKKGTFMFIRVRLRHSVTDNIRLEQIAVLVSQVLCHGLSQHIVAGEGEGYTRQGT